MTSVAGGDDSLSLITGGLMSLSLDTPLSLTPPRGYPIKVLEVPDKKYQCGQCRLILRSPVQSYCGHRFCKDCLVYLIRTSSEPVTCPICLEEGIELDEAGILAVAQTFPDNAIKREFARMKVRCPFTECKWAGSFKEFEVHYGLCEFFLEVCSVCTSEVLRSEMPTHQFTVHDIGTDCPFGCGQKIDISKNIAHMQDYSQQHFEAVNRRIESLERSFEVHGLVSSDECASSSRPAPIQKMAQLERVVEALDDELRNLRISAYRLQQMGSVASGLPPATADALSTIKDQLSIHEAIITVLSREIERLSLQLETQDVFRREDREKLESVERKSKTVEQVMMAKDAVITELDKRITSMELTSFDGVLLWKVSDYQRRRQDAVTQRTASVYSPVFYTSPTGYKMCARLYLNGDGLGRDTHVSLFFVIMRGQYDALLKWPFTRKVTLTIFDQESERESVVDSFRPDPTSSSFRCPVTDVNVASGCPKFIPITQLENTANNFVKDNAIFIKIVVDQED